MSSCPFSFPGYAEAVEFSHDLYGRRAFFFTEDLYRSALQDPNLILGAAYFGSPDHQTFLRTVGISSVQPIPVASARVETLERALIRHGFRQVTDPMSWAVRCSQIIVSRLLQRFPALVEFFPSATSQQLFDLVLTVFLDLGLPSRVENQYQDMTVTDLDHALVDILHAVSGEPSLPMEYCDPLAPAGPIRSISAFPSLVFSCPPINEDPTMHEKIDQILAIIPRDLANIFAASPKSLHSPENSSAPSVSPRLHRLDTAHPNFRKNLNRHLDQLLHTFGIDKNFRLDNPFPVDQFIEHVTSYWEVNSVHERFPGDAVEFHCLGCFDDFQRRCLRDMFRNHVSLKPFRQSLKTTSIMPPTIPEKTPPRNSRTQWVLGSGTGLTNATTVPLNTSKSTPLLTTQSGSDSGSCPGLRTPWPPWPRSSWDDSSSTPPPKSRRASSSTVPLCTCVSQQLVTSMPRSTAVRCMSRRSRI